MKRVYVDGIELFSPGFAAKLHKKAAERLYGAHGQPRSKESAAGKVGTTTEAAQAKANMKPVDAAKSADCGGKRPKPAGRQMKLRL